MTAIKITQKGQEWFVDQRRTGSEYSFSPISREHSASKAIQRAAEFLGVSIASPDELESLRRNADAMRDALATVRSELGAAWPAITEDVMQRVEVVCDVVGVRGDTHRCSRCLKLVSSEGIHTCTPTAGWREIERQRDELMAVLESGLFLFELGRDSTQRGADRYAAAVAAIASAKGGAA